MRLILAFFGSALSVPAAEACSCMEQTPEQAAESTGVAYVGRVVATPTTARANGNMLEREVEVLVVDPILGVQQDQSLRLRVLIGSSASCGVEYPFVVGDEWLFFNAGDYRITLCAPDRPMTRGAVRQLHDRYGKKASPESCDLPGLRALSGPHPPPPR